MCIYIYYTYVLNCVTLTIMTKFMSLDTMECLYIHIRLLKSHMPNYDDTNDTL